MTIAAEITRDTVRRAARGRRAVFAAECLLYVTSLLGVGGMAAVLWALRLGPPFLAPGGPWALAVVVLLVAAAGAAALHRYRRPDRTVAIALTVLVVQLAALAAPLDPSPVGLLGWMLEWGPGPVLLGALVRRARPLVGGAATVAMLAFAVLHGSFVPRTDGAGQPVLGVLDLLPAVVLVVAPAVTGAVLRALDTAWRAAELTRVRAEERLLLARELHDMIGNHVTGMTMYAQVAAADDGVPEHVRELLRAIETTGGDALAAMRRMVGALRSADGIGELNVMPPSATTLDGAVTEAVGSTDGVTVRVDPELAAPAHDVVATVHRVVVEALTNVRRHAPGASSVEVRITAGVTGGLVVEVTDDGADGSHAAPAPGSGLGLIGLRERMDALDGTLVAGPVAGGGWRVRAELPDRPVSERLRATGDRSG